MVSKSLQFSLIKIIIVKACNLLVTDLLTYCRLTSQFLVCDSSAAFSFYDVNPLQLVTAIKNYNRLTRVLLGALTIKMALTQRVLEQRVEGVALTT